MTDIPIYQFCRAFENVRWSDVYQRYVSGGYAFEKITRWNREVPEEIRQAVINGYFALNDNYPPEEDDFALMAREIDDKYSVLAIANSQLDDGGRAIIGYKYFWLEKSSPDVDGIGTLIFWWSGNEPKFNMAELLEQSAPEIFYYQQEYQKPTFQEAWLQNTKEIVEKLTKIPCTTVVKKQEWQGLPEYLKVHYLALGLSFRAKYFNAWAWNFKKILFPETFLAIFYTTQEDIPNNISKFQLGIISNSSVELPSKKIKTCLVDLARIFTHQHRLDPKRTEELFGYLQDYPDANWSECIDKTMLKNSSPHDIYPQLIYLIAPNNILAQECLLNMVNSLEIETRKASPFEDFRERLIISLLGEPENDNEPKITELQQYLLEASKKYPDVQVSKKVEDSIYSGISFLLEKLINTEQNFDKNDAKILAQKIDYFLTKSSSVWQIYFQKYAEIVAKITLYEDYEEANNYPSVITFWQPILDILSNLKNVHEQNRRYNYGNYKSLAIIFSKTQRKDLSEFLYRMSGNSGSNIPPEIRNSLDTNIRSRLFSVPNSTIYGQGTSSPSSHNDHNDRGDGGAKAIFGFLFFLAGNIIFFTSITHWPKLIIPRVLTYLIFTISAIVLTGNPFKIRNVNIQAALSFIYLFVAVAFLVGSFDIQAISKNQICSNVNLMESYENFEKCYKSTQETQQLKIMKDFVPNDPENQFAQKQAQLANKYISESTNRKMFDERKKKLEFCKSTKYTFYRECVTAKDRDFTSY